MLMCGDVRGDQQIEFFHIMACYILTMNNCGNVPEDFNESIDWMLPYFHEIKYTSVALTINK